MRMQPKGRARRNRIACICGVVTAEGKKVCGVQVSGDESAVRRRTCARLNLRYAADDWRADQRRRFGWRSAQRSIRQWEEATAPKDFELTIQPDQSRARGPIPLRLFLPGAYGIPAFLAWPGHHSCEVGHGMRTGGRTAENEAGEFTAERYHQPSDEYKTGDGLPGGGGGKRGWRSSASNMGWAGVGANGQGQGMAGGEMG